jgi:hypothetical protein
MKRFQKYASPYQAINILTGLLIVCVLGYSAFYSYDHREHPIGCVHVAVSGLECSTCGLSQSFSMMIRGNYESAVEYNRNGPLLFGFFAAQFFLRALAGALISRIGRQRLKFPVRTVAWSDAAVSFALFIICFRFLLAFWQ